jgi:hypothetical protein
MEFVHASTNGRLDRRVNIIDGPVMPHPSSSTGKKIRVQQVTLSYTLKGDEWTVNSWSLLSMGGVVLKKDGSEGKETWGGGVSYGWDKSPRYGWLRKLVEAMRPEGTPVLPFRLSGLENDDLEGTDG